jgi:hypothetical protein
MKVPPVDNLPRRTKRGNNSSSSFFGEEACMFAATTSTRGEELELVEKANVHRDSQSLNSLGSSIRASSSIRLHHKSVYYNIHV